MSDRAILTIVCCISAVLTLVASAAYDHFSPQPAAATEFSFQLSPDLRNKAKIFGGSDCQLTVSQSPDGFFVKNGSLFIGHLSFGEHTINISCQGGAYADTWQVVAVQDGVWLAGHEIDGGTYRVPPAEA